MSVSEDYGPSFGTVYVCIYSLEMIHWPLPTHVTQVMRSCSESKVSFYLEIWSRMTRIFHLLHGKGRKPLSVHFKIHLDCQRATCAGRGGIVILRIFSLRYQEISSSARGWSSGNKVRSSRAATFAFLPLSLLPLM